MSAEEVVAVPLNEMEPSKLMLTNVHTRTWNYKDKESGDMCSGSCPEAEVCYENPQQKFCFSLQNVRTITGIQTSVQYKSLFMSIALDEEQSAMAKAKFDPRMRELIFAERFNLMKGDPNLRDLKDPSEIKYSYNPLVTPGKPKNDGSEDFYQDSITVTVPSKKDKKQVVIDSNACTVETADSKPYAWAAVTGGMLKEVVIEVRRVKYDKKIKLCLEARLIVPDQVARSKITTKRKLDQSKEDEDKTDKAAKKVKGKDTKDAKPAAKPMQSRNKTPVSAFAGKLKQVTKDAVQEKDAEDEGDKSDKDAD